jgi:hypothetical protein
VHKEAERLKHGEDSDYGGDEDVAACSYIDDGTSPWAEAEISRVEVALQVSPTFQGHVFCRPVPPFSLVRFASCATPPFPPRGQMHRTVSDTNSKW